MELVTEDVREFSEGTFLENAPIVPVSAATGEGLDSFVRTLDEYCTQLPEREPSSLFRLPADRVFTIKGFGTVITGTLISGKITTGEPVMIYPSGIKTKVRGLQVHDQSVTQAETGQRTAINFQGIEKVSVSRGDVVARPDTLRSSYMLDVDLLLLESNERPVKNREQVRLHTGTSEIACNVILLDREDLIAGEQAIVQLRLDEPVVCVRDDRFVLRSYSPVRTLGGGRILNPVPRKHKRYRTQAVERLQTLLTDDPETLINFHLQEAGYTELSLADLSIMTNLSANRLESAIQGLLSRQILIQTDKEPKHYIHQETLEHFKTQAVEQLSRYHRKHPLKTGMPKGELKSKFPPVLSNKLFNQLIHRMVQADAICQAENTIRLPDHEVRLAEDESDLKEKILAVYEREGLQPPVFKDLVKHLNIRSETAKNIVMHLVDEGKLVKAKDDLFFHHQVLAGLQEKLVSYLKANGEIDTPAFKEMTGVSRKYTIPLLEYFDSANVTIRVGDARKLRRSG
ncbi:MAG: selenocysteine-specific translation elongation factor, partial [Thermodesulfobacteriota bacterium]